MNEWRKKAVNLRQVGLLLVEFKKIVPTLLSKLDGKFANRVYSFIWHPRVFCCCFCQTFNMSLELTSLT